jgi:hypothetical protein
MYTPCRLPKTARKKGSFFSGAFSKHLFLYREPAASILVGTFGEDMYAVSAQAVLTAPNNYLFPAPKYGSFLPRHQSAALAAAAIHQAACRLQRSL